MNRCQRLGLKIMDWNSGQSSPTYAVGSSLFAGRKVSRDLADQVAGEFVALAPQARERKHGWTAKDARDLERMSRTLRGNTYVVRGSH